VNPASSLLVEDTEQEDKEITLFHEGFKATKQMEQEKAVARDRHGKHPAKKCCQSDRNPNDLRCFWRKVPL